MQMSLQMSLLEKAGVLVGAVVGVEIACIAMDIVVAVVDGIG